MFDRWTFAFARTGPAGAANDVPNMGGIWRTGQAMSDHLGRRAVAVSEDVSGHAPANVIATVATRDAHGRSGRPSVQRSTDTMRLDANETAALLRALDPGPRNRPLASLAALQEHAAGQECGRDLPLAFELAVIGHEVLIRLRDTLESAEGSGVRVGASEVLLACGFARGTGSTRGGDETCLRDVADRAAHLLESEAGAGDRLNGAAARRT